MCWSKGRIKKKKRWEARDLRTEENDRRFWMRQMVTSIQRNDLSRESRTDGETGRNIVRNFWGMNAWEDKKNRWSRAGVEILMRRRGSGSDIRQADRQTASLSPGGKTLTEVPNTPIDGQINQREKKVNGWEEERSKAGKEKQASSKLLQKGNICHSWV